MVQPLETRIVMVNPDKGFWSDLDLCASVSPWFSKEKSAFLSSVNPGSSQGCSLRPGSQKAGTRVWGLDFPFLNHPRTTGFSSLARVPEARSPRGSGDWLPRSQAGSVWRLLPLQFNPPLRVSTWLFNPRPGLLCPMTQQPLLARPHRRAQTCRGESRRPGWQR